MKKILTALMIVCTFVLIGCGGGKGTDVFVYNKGDGNDTILDYEEGEIISIEGDKVKKISESGKNVVFTFDGNGKVTASC